VKIQTANFNPNDYPDEQVHQIYNGLDTMLTLEILREIQRSTNQPEPIHYGFSRALQAPILEIMLRGFAIDEPAKAALINTLKGEREIINGHLQKMALAVCGDNVNPNSTLQLQKLFYSTMKLPEVWTSSKGKRSLSMNRESLEKLSVYFHAEPLINCILAIRERDKLIQTLTTEISPDGRYRTSYNIGGTETGRLSSSSSADGTGGNAQNLAPAVRRIFCADPGYRLYCIDLEQAESREVGWTCGLLFMDWTYLDSCEGGDLHTSSAKLIWTGLPWTGEPKGDRAIADRNFYREFSYRDMSKRGGHAMSYYGTPFTVARHLKVPTKLMTDFQSRFFEAYPAIPCWHQHVATQLQTTQHITNAFGVERGFFGRPGDDTTLREAIAHGPQSSTAFRTNLWLWRVWKHMGQKVQLLGQTHDSITFQAPIESDPHEIASEALELLRIELVAPSGRKFTVPGECKLGYNWAPWTTSNPDGLIKIANPNSLRPRTKQTTILERIL
jgi:DNA polymerase I-like protein with 3'-5' exonuclease and polymerase domains